MLKQNNLTGVAFRFREQSDGLYRVRFTSDGFCHVFYFDGQEFQQLANVSSPQIHLTPGVDNHFSLKVSGSNIMIYDKKEEILTLLDDNITHPGKISIGTDLWLENSQAEVEFDNLKITKIPN